MGFDDQEKDDQDPHEDNLDVLGRDCRASSKAFADDSLTKFYRDAAKAILDQSGQELGFCLVLGSDEGK